MMHSGNPVMIRFNEYWQFGRDLGEGIQTDIENFDTLEKAMKWAEVYHAETRFNIQGHWIGVKQIRHMQRIKDGKKTANREGFMEMKLEGYIVRIKRSRKRAIAWKLTDMGESVLKYLQSVDKV